MGVNFGLRVKGMNTDCVCVREQGADENILNKGTQLHNEEVHNSYYSPNRPIKDDQEESDQRGVRV
jgi:hypothetical protein